jgi:cytochrome c-type biogenesis protein CcmE
MADRSVCLMTIAISGAVDECCAALGVIALAVALVLGALKESIVFFNSPTDVVEKHIKPGTRIRVGGLVKRGSVWRGDSLVVRFEVTDGKRTIPVAYQGLLPDLFREGQGVVAEGALDSAGTFRADSVLAKHDETYMPKDVADALKKQGYWKARRRRTGKSAMMHSARSDAGCHRIDVGYWA